MPKFHDVAQGSTAWLKLRAGIPTASEFDRILTPTGKPSASAETYLQELLAERMMGRPIDRMKTEWMERGNEMEQSAVDFYEFSRNAAIATIGFVTVDSGKYGCSPDRLIGEDGLLEIKAPSPGVHIQYLLFEDHKRKYYSQLQGQLLVTDRSYVDIVSYHPEMPTAVVRVHRDEEFIGKLTKALESFCEMLDLKTKELERLHGPIGQPEPEPPEFLSDADVELIIRSRAVQV